MKRLIRAATAFLVLAGCILLFATDAGATFPATAPVTGVAPYYGECNVAFNIGSAVTQPEYNGYAVMLSCNVDVPNGDVPNIINPVVGVNGNTYATYYSEDIPNQVDDSGTVNCSSTSSHLMWWGRISGFGTSGDVAEACSAGGVSTVENCLMYVCAPPAIFADGPTFNSSTVQEMVAFNYLKASGAYTGYTGYDVQEIIAYMPWGNCNAGISPSTYNGYAACSVSGGTTTPTYYPTTSQLNDSCTGSLIVGTQSPTSSSSPQGVIIYGSTPGTESPTQQNVVEDNVTCEEESFTWPSFPSDIAPGGTDAGATSQACTLVSINSSITGNTIGAANKNYPVTFTYTGGASIVLVDPSDNTSLSLEGQSFASDADIDADPTSPDTISVTPTVGSAYSPYQAWCYSSSTGWVNWGSIISGSQVYSNPPGSNGNSIGGCFADSGMTLYDPISWITGAWSLGVCVIHYLVVPSTDDIQNFTNLFGFTSSGAASGCGATAPGLTTGSITQWLGAGFTLITDGPSCSFNTMATEEADAQTSSYLSTGDTFHDNGHDYTVSLPAAISSATGNGQVSPFFVILLAILTAVIGVFLFFAVKDIITSLLSKNG